MDSTPVSDASVEIESPSMFDEPQSENVEIEDTVTGSEPIKTQSSHVVSKLKLNHAPGRFSPD